MSVSTKMGIVCTEHDRRWRRKAGGDGDFSPYSKLGLTALLKQIGARGGAIFWEVHIVRNKLDVYGLLILSST